VLTSIVTIEPDCHSPSENTLFSFLQQEGSFIGLIGLVRKYLNSLDIDTDTACTVTQYLNLIRDRANGKASTTATWTRKFVTEHPEYK